jgi:MFS family permease
MMNSFGGFQSHYVQSLSRSPSDIAWIGSIQMFCLFFVGTFAGRLTDAGYFRLVFAAGAALIVFGTLITSACTQYWQILLAQGLCVGIGNGCVFTPALAVLSTYFKKRQSIAIGLAACGSATGGVIFPSIVRQLLPRVGFAWTMRVIGIIHVVSLTFSLASLKPRIPPRRTGRLVEWTAFRDLEYTYFALGAFLVRLPPLLPWYVEADRNKFFWGVFVAFFFIAAFARDAQGFTYTQSLDLLMIMNGVGILGRLVPNYLGDRIGTLTVIIPVVGLGAIVAFCWMAIDSPTKLYVWAACSGPVLGGIQAMFPSALASLTADPGKQGTRIGMVFTIVSFAVLTGTPIAGALLSAMKGSYVGAQVFSGTSLALGTISAAVAREVKRRRQGGPFTAKV